MKPREVRRDRSGFLIVGVDPLSLVLSGNFYDQSATLNAVQMWQARAESELTSIEDPEPTWRLRTAAPGDPTALLASANSHMGVVYTLRHIHIKNSA